MRLIRLPKVEEKTGLRKSSIYGLPSFPSPVKIGPRASAWVEEEVDEWIAARVRRDPFADLKQARRDVKAARHVLNAALASFADEEISSGEG